MVFRGPVAQTVEDQGDVPGVVAVQRVAAAGEVVIIAIRRQQVVGLIVDTPERDSGHFVAFRGVVEHHVENDLDPGAMQFLDRRLEFVDLHAERSGDSEAGLRRKEIDGAVAPVIIQRVPGSGPGRLFSNRQIRKSASTRRN